MTSQEIAQHLEAMAGHLQVLLVQQADKPCPSVQKALVNTTEAVKALRDAKA